MKVPSSIIHDDEPVSEEFEVGIVAATVLKDELKEYLDTKRTRLLWSFGTGTLAVIAGLYLTFGGSGGAGLLLAGVGITAFGVGTYLYRRSPEVRLKRAEKRFWTGHLLPSPNGVMVVDGTGTVSDTEFEVEVLAQEDELSRTSDELRNEGELPIILPRERNIESDLKDEFSRLEQTLTNTNRTSVRVPPIGQASPIVDGIDEVLPYAEENEEDGGFVKIPITEACEKVDKIENLESLAFEDDVDETFSDLKTHSKRALDEITESQKEMVDLLNESIESTGDLLTLISYNFYCPDCLMDEIYSTLELETSGGNLEWYCGTCRSYHGLEEATPKNRIKDELIDEIWDRLWIEKDD